VSLLGLRGALDSIASHVQAKEATSSLAAAGITDPDTIALTAMMAAMGCRGTFAPTGWTPPDDLTEEEWLHMGRVLRSLPNDPNAIAGHREGIKYDLGIPIDDVILVPEYRCRSEFDLDVVRHYSTILDRLPLIEVNQRNELIDGRYRLEAHKARGMKRIRVKVTQTETREDCLALFCQRNSSHGLPYNDADRAHQARRLREINELATDGDAA
jgi:hypothetical protein